MGTKIASTMQYRSVRNVNGSAYGTPSFDPMNPLLHSNTNSHGIAAAQRVERALSLTLKGILNHHLIVRKLPRLRPGGLGAFAHGDHERDHMIFR